MVELVVYVAIIVIVLALVFWLLQQIPLPPPLDKFVIIAIVVIGAVVVIGLLLQLTGSVPPFKLGR